MRIPGLPRVDLDKVKDPAVQEIIRAMLDWLSRVKDALERQT